MVVNPTEQSYYKGTVSRLGVALTDFSTQLFLSLFIGYRMLCASVYKSYIFTIPIKL